MTIQHKVSDDFFEITFEQNYTNTRLGLVSDITSTYGQNGNQKEIDDVLSHLVALDAARKENIKKDGVLDTPFINFSISYSGENNKRVDEFLSVPLGMGHFEKGINFLRDRFNDVKQDDEELGINVLNELLRKVEPKEHLNKFCSALKIPPTISLDELEEKGFATIDKMASLAQGLSSPELASFLTGFQGGIRESRAKNNSGKVNDEKFTQLMSSKLDIPLEEAKQIVENSQAKNTKEIPNTESTNEVSQEKLEEIKKRSEIAIKNQKKTKGKTRERSNQNPSLGKNL